MIYILILILLLNFSFFISIFFKKNIEETFVLSISLIIILLFIFGVILNLLIGFYFLLLLNLGLFVYNVYFSIKKPNEMKKILITPGLLLLVLSSLIFIWIDHNRVFSIWDEFSHWALVVKNMFYLNNFGLANTSTTLIKTYLSGPGLFQYFCAKLSGTYNESVIYFAFNLLFIAYLLPIFKKFKSFGSLSLYLSYFFVITIPMIFYSSVYSSIYVDALLGVAFAYSLYSYYLNYENKLSRFNIFNLAISTMMLIFIKDIGLVLSLITIFVVLLDNLFIKNKFDFKIKSIYKNSVWIFLSFVPTLIVKALWDFLLKTNNVLPAINTKTMITNMFNLIFHKLSGYKSLVAHDYINSLFYSNLSESSIIELTFVISVGFFILISYFACKDIKNIKIKNSQKMMSIVMVFGSAFYSFIILVTAYLSIFTEYEATRLASFQRYMSTYSLALIIIAFAFLINKYQDEKKNLITPLIISFSILMFFVNFTAILNTSIFARSGVIASQNVRNSYKTFKDITDIHVKKNELLYFVSTNDSGLDFYTANYEFTPKKMNLNYGWSIGAPYNEGDVWTVMKTEDEWANELTSNYSYVYLYDIDEEFINKYGGLFDISLKEINDNQLYAVNKNSKNKKILKLVE